MTEEHDPGEVKHFRVNVERTRVRHYPDFKSELDLICQLAKQEAERLCYPVVDGRHLLLAIAKLGGCSASQFLRSHDIGLREIRNGLLTQMQHNPHVDQVTVSGPPPMPDVKPPEPATDDAQDHGDEQPKPIKWREFL